MLSWAKNKHVRRGSTVGYMGVDQDGVVRCRLNVNLKTPEHHRHQIPRVASLVNSV
jgi:hypothetical protein